MVKLALSALATMVSISLLPYARYQKGNIEKKYRKEILNRNRLGSPDKTMGQLSLAWKAIHIGLPMQVTAYILGTIVTRMCAVLLVSKQQPGRLYLGLSLHKLISTYRRNLLQLNVEVKPSRILSACSFLPRATLCLPPVTNIGKPMCTAFQAGCNQ